MNPISEKKISDCFTIDFEHKKDDRDWKTIEDLAPVPSLVKKGQFDEALTILDGQKKTMDDFDFIYAWKAFVFQKQHKYDQAEKILAQGIKNARAKNLLCDRLGYLYYDTGNMENAVEWWIKSILIMTRTKASFLWEPFLYLAYTAKACNRNKEFHLLINIASQSHGELALEKEAETDIVAKAATLKTSFVPQAIQALATLLESPEPEDHPNPEDRSEKNKLDIPENNQTTGPQKKPFPVGWKWVVAVLIFAAAAAFLLFSATLNRPEQARQSSVSDPIIKTEVTPMSSDVSPPPEPIPDRPDHPGQEVLSPDSITADSKKASNDDIPPPFEKKTTASAPLSDAIVDHKMKAVYLKNKNKQPISKLQKKNNEQISE